MPKLMYLKSVVFPICVKLKRNIFFISGKYNIPQASCPVKKHTLPCKRNRGQDIQFLAARLFISKTLYRIGRRSFY